MDCPSPTDSAGSSDETCRSSSDSDGWLVERLVDLDPEGRAQYAQQLRAEGNPLATRAEQYVRAFDGTLRLGLSRLLSRPAAVAVASMDAPALSPLVEGDVVGAYRIVREIGRGGMGVVYLAERDDPGLRAALKVLDEPVPASGGEMAAPNCASDDARRFHAERRHLARLSHPGVPRIYDAGRTATGIPFYAMELVEGVPLDEYVEQRGLGAVERVSLFAQLCETVRHVHGQGLAHGDLKPANVLVQDGEPPGSDRRPRPIVRLVDFGVAGETGGTSTTGPRPFTPAYAAPEIFDGASPSVAADIYALGAVLGDLVASSPKVRNGLARRSVETDGVVTMPLFDAVIRATRPSVAERYGSVDHLLADVREAAIAVAWATVPVVRAGTPPRPTRTTRCPRVRSGSWSPAPQLWAVLAGVLAGAAAGWWSGR